MTLKAHPSLRTTKASSLSRDRGEDNPRSNWLAVPFDSGGSNGHYTLGDFLSLRPCSLPHPQSVWRSDSSFSELLGPHTGQDQKWSSPTQKPGASFSELSQPELTAIQGTGDYPRPQVQAGVFLPTTQLSCLFPGWSHECCWSVPLGMQNVWIFWFIPSDSPKDTCNPSLYLWPWGHPKMLGPGLLPYGITLIWHHDGENPTHGTEVLDREKYTMLTLV